jgi:lysozyme family protein
MAISPESSQEQTKEIAEGLKPAREALDNIKKEVSTTSKVSEKLKKAANELKEGNKKEAAKALAGIAGMALLNYILPKEKEEDEEKNDEGVKVTEVEGEVETEGREYKAETNKKGEPEEESVLTETETGTGTVCTKTENTQKILADHKMNVRIMEVLPRSEGNLNEFLEKYEENKARYEKVAEKVHLPAMLIAALHNMESNMNFDRYLHNGDPLGEMTSNEPVGILFRKDQWEESAIHALGGNIRDNNGTPSMKYFQDIREELGITEDTTDIGKMLTLAEKYNGLGYRYKGLQSAYIYGGTNVMNHGKFVADGEFDPNVTSKRIGVASMLMKVQSTENNIPIKIAESNTLLADLSNERAEINNGKEIARTRTRLLQNNVSEEGLAILNEMNEADRLVEIGNLGIRKGMELKETPYKALVLANEEAKKDGYEIKVFSGYRSPKDQQALHEREIRKNGEVDPRLLGRVGGSWHQSGGAVDVFLTKNGKRLSPRGSKEESGTEASKKLEYYMNRAGFVRYEKEDWHFEIGSDGWSEVMQKTKKLDNRITSTVYERDQLAA